MEATIRRQQPNTLLFFMVMIFAFLLVNAVITYGQHAVAKHGEDAEQVRRCMETKGPMQTWVKPDGRVIYVCQVEWQKFGIMITDGTHEITSYIKEKLKTLGDIERYLHNIGADKLIQ